MISQEKLLAAYRHACELELQAFKPGNVSIYADGHNMAVRDFRVSMNVSAYPLVNPRHTLGEKIYYAVKATRDAVGCNTNLGIILLCAPLIQAAEKLSGKTSLRSELAEVLIHTTIGDAEWAYQAISLASPGGLGRSDRQDVHEKPEMTLMEAMRIAATRDRIALQYVTGYKDIFEFSILRYNSALNRWGDEKWAALAVYVSLLCRFSDSHIERKYGNKFTSKVMSAMARVNEALLNSDRPENVMGLLSQADSSFKSAGINPGTTADMTVATVLAVNLERLISKPGC